MGAPLSSLVPHWVLARLRQDDPHSELLQRRPGFCGSQLGKAALPRALPGPWADHLPAPQLYSSRRLPLLSSMEVTFQRDRTGKASGKQLLKMNHAGLARARAGPGFVQNWGSIHLGLTERLWIHSDSGKLIIGTRGGSKAHLSGSVAAAAILGGLSLPAPPCPSLCNRLPLPRTVPCYMGSPIQSQSLLWVIPYNGRVLTGSLWTTSKWVYLGAKH